MDEIRVKSPSSSLIFESDNNANAAISLVHASLMLVCVIGSIITAVIFFGWWCFLEIPLVLLLAAIHFLAIIAMWRSLYTLSHPTHLAYSEGDMERMLEDANYKEHERKKIISDIFDVRDGVRKSKKEIGIFEWARKGLSTALWPPKFTFRPPIEVRTQRQG